MMTTRANKLIIRIHLLLEKMNEYDYRIHAQVYRCIDQYYYRQKEEELITIHRTSLMERLSSEQILHHYIEIYQHWRHDVRWLNHHQLFNAPCLKSPTSAERNALWLH